MHSLQLNGTKIMYHIHELQKWSTGAPVYPIQVEISPTNQCNHHCVFCAYDYISRKKRHFLDMELLGRTITELRSLGTKSLFYSGEGEPLLHKGLPSLIERAANLGFSQALNTNGVFMDKERRERILPNLEWLRISINAPNPESYVHVHRCGPQDFNRVLANVEAMATLAAQKKLAVAIGIQMVYMGQNIKGLYSFISHLRDIGVHYFSIKRFNQHPDITKRQFSIENEKIDPILLLATPHFKVVLRDNFIQSPVNRTYRRCYGMDFYAEIISNGDVFSCGPHLGNPNFCYGNIGQASFKEIWSPENREAMHKRIAEMGDLDTICMPNCRLHEINNFLWNLRHVPEHINFI